ncbi:sporulation-induced protein [Lecanora helva]
MFWRFGGYANVSTLNNILEKPDVTLEEVLDESDLIQELKQSNSKLIEFLRDDNILRRLLELVVAAQTPRPEDDGEEEDSEEEQIREKSISPFRRKKREKSQRQEEIEEWEKADKARGQKAYTACEVLSSETWSILESLMENQQLLRTFWDFLKREAPLDPTDASYFTKINETLLDKKTEDMIKFLQSLEDVVPMMLKHIDCAGIMDLLLKMISVEKSEGGVGIVDWLQSQDLIPRLLAFLSQDHAPGTQTSAGDFLKAIVTMSANASQNDQQVIGPNNMTRQLVSEPCVENLLGNMLRGGNPLTVGVGMVIEIIRKNNSDYDPDVGGGPDAPPSSSDPIYLGTLLRCFAKRVPDFMELLLSRTHAVAEGSSQVTIERKELGVAFGNKIEPLGFDRFKTCELMAELLHCSNMGLLNERGSEAFVKQRDEERERLKAEGALNPRPPQSAITEFSEDSANFTNGVSPLGLNSSAEETRKLEIQNNAEDDGFEDVGSSADLAEDIKDDFDEKDEKSPFEIDSEPPPARMPSLMPNAKPRLDLDEDFVDEPLTSPRLEAVDEKEAEEPEAEIPTPLVTKHEPEPESPTSGLSSAVDHLAVSEDIAMTEHQTFASPEPTATLMPTEPPVSHDLTEQPGNADAPPLPQRERHLDPSAPETDSPRDISPHPDDKPAPLFASRPNQAAHDHEDARPAELEAAGSDRQGTPETTQAEEGDTNRSMHMSETEQSFTPHFEYDIDGQLMVGDFLKMMFVEHHVVPTILDFFFRFPWNNFLHNVVYDVVQQVFNGPMDRGYNRTLAIDLFQTGHITDRIVDGQAKSDEAQAKNNMRLGYMGHLTLVAEEVVKFSDRHPPELLSQSVLEMVTSQQWNDYVEHTLSETRERDNAILGGVRPDMSLGPRQAVLNAVNAAHGFGTGASSALANAGLNGNTGLDSMDLASNGSATSNSAFGLSSGNSLLSGFGSSSDEEDEEMDEIEEGDGTATNQDSFLPSHASLSVIPSPPTDPPPAPPPLNLPPSRARRQLAARLALHSQQKAEASENSGEHNEASEHERTTNSNPSDNLDNDDDDGEEAPLQFGGPLHARKPSKDESEKTPPHVIPVEHRQLDLDDFANSLAADPDDRGSSEEEQGPDGEDSQDVEMRIALG